ncbi:single-stranded-DNA-specific exonuclease RecJ [Tetragenococcus muriaticus]|uniref:Single-stranded-DNA-specific exonuclease RecJ n=2 Tax=Tetragenococcus muriaticus TaxID=64642 RepID=A0A091C2K7_9ENTE|nr:single-stranded-DNA-specific exonuclease RecJ [Tetragenococcus muriaticus]KFN91189.1 single-stranded DNA-specific exonuclease [Tetragenococcus muriaticus 3MR10-3]KFN91629.1 single-stranded DNA-specific exonuclease [Tetragenococcus muriaticus PMC-11-5]GMA47211.1 single-stranded-DNA-specific exonuclease RecJ [Tetragenococcus muriaticus]
MKQANYHWQFPEMAELPQKFISQLKNENMPLFLGQLLWQRGIKSAEAIKAFFHPSLDHLYDPFWLFGMEKAITRVQKALENEEKILIYGDYDADGITSTSLMKETLELLGADVCYYLPNRFKDGYGPNIEVYKEKIAAGVGLILTVDNGVGGSEAIDFANSQGVDVIVTDHHELPPSLPNAYAIIHPRHPEGRYPFGELAGVGVAFKFACALLDEVPTDFLDLVAIGTVADMVSLTDENRALVTFGLQALKQTQRIGLLELLNVSQISSEAMDESTIGFAIAPRLNALGRLKDPNEAVELLTTFDQSRARHLSEQLDQVNNERKTLTQEITEEAIQQIEPDKKIQIISGQNWHEGVLGIVAGNIAQKVGQPTIVLTSTQEGLLKGSGRSVDSVNLFKLLDQVRELMTSFGGHHAAVGLSITRESLSYFTEKVNEILDTSQIQPINNLAIDTILSLADVSLQHIEALQSLAPFGMDNPLPYVLFKDCTVINTRAVGADGKHLKLSIKDDSQVNVEGIGFGFGPDIAEFQSEPADIVGQLSINEWNHKRIPQIMLKDYRINYMQVFDYRSKKYWKNLSFIEPTLFVSFSDKEATELSHKTDQPVVTYKDQESFLATIKDMTFQQMVLINCPIDLQEAKNAIHIARVSRVFFICLAKDEAYLDGMGTREQYAKLFQFISKQQRVDVRYKLSLVAQHLDIPENLLAFMIQVFFDLGFVTIKDGMMNQVESPKSQALSESQTYQKRLSKIKTEEFLLLSDLPTLKHWLST